MRTRFELVLDGGEEAFLRSVGEEAVDEIHRTEAELSRFRRDSFLSHVMREAVRGPVPLPADLFELMQRVQVVHERSGGAFDPTVSQDDRAGGEPPMTSARTRPVNGRDATHGMGAIRLDPQSRTLELTRPGIALDLGGVGKGFALDRAATVLREAAIPCALLHAGTSTITAIGAPPDRTHWQVAVRDPRESRSTGIGDAASDLDVGRDRPRGTDARIDGPGGNPRLVATVWLRNQSLSVSANHGRTRGGAQHVLDPRDGAPADAALLAAVVHQHATEADAWSTALLVTGGVGDAADGGFPQLLVRGSEAGASTNDAQDDPLRVSIRDDVDGCFTVPSPLHTTLN